MTAHALLDEAGGVVRVTFTRDDKLNAVSSEMFGLLEDAGCRARGER